jgi:hypothetical protein
MVFDHTQLPFFSCLPQTALHLGHLIHRSGALTPITVYYVCIVYTYLPSYVHLSLLIQYHNIIAIQYDVLL